MAEYQTTEQQQGKTFKELIKNKLESWRKQYDDDNRYRVTEAVTMVRRDRSDYFGNFEQEWLDKRHPLQYRWNTQMSKGMVTYPVIRRSVNAKIATELATSIKLTMEPVRKDPQTEAIVQQAEKMVSFGRRTIWNEQFDYEQSKIRQLSRCVYVNISKDEEDGVSIPFPNMVPKPQVSGIYTLDCATCGNQITPEEVGAPNPITDIQANLDAVFDAHSTAKQARLDSDDPEKVPEPDFQQHYEDATHPDSIDAAQSQEQYFCPICAENAAGQSAQGEEIGEMPEPPDQEMLEGDPMAAQPTGSPLTPNLQNMSMDMAPAHDGTFTYKKSGQINGKLVSPLLTRIDEFNALGFKMHKAHWFNYRFLLPTYEVEQMCGENQEAKDAVKKHTQNQWSDAVRWHYELMKNRGNVTPEFGGDSLTHLTECEIWWIRPIACNGWKATGDEPIGDWEIKRGQTIEESFTKNRKAKKFEGLCVFVVGDEIIKVMNEDFRKKWFGIAWTVDPHSYFPQGEERLLHLQDAATRVFTLVYSHSQRSSAPRTIANGIYFTRADLEANVVGGIIMTKPNVRQPQDLDLNRHIFNLEAGELPEMMQSFVEMLITCVKEETGIYDEVTGAGDPHNKTKGGREIALNRSLGLQYPEMQSKGVGVKEFAYRYLEHCQQMPDEYFTLFIDEDEEEWSTTDIENFRKCKIRDEINISVTEGSDVPRNRAELEEAYGVAIMEGLFDPMSPTPVDIRSIILKIRGIDYDVDDYDSNMRVANVRYDAIRSMLMSLNPGDAIKMVPEPDPIDPTGRTPLLVEGEMVLNPQLDPAILQELMQSPQTQPQEFADNHLIFINFFKKKLYGVIGSRNINQVLVLGINAYIAAHRGYVAAEMSRQMSLEATSSPDPNAENGKDAGNPGKKGGPPTK